MNGLHIIGIGRRLNYATLTLGAIALAALSGCGSEGGTTTVDPSTDPAGAGSGVLVPSTGQTLTPKEIELTPEEMTAMGVNTSRVTVLEMTPSLPVKIVGSGGGDIGSVSSALTVSMPSLPKFIPPKIKGDREYNGTKTREPKYHCEARIFVCGGTKLCATLMMDAWENDGDGTEAFGTSPSIQFWPGNGRTIRSINSPAFDQLDGEDNNGYGPQILPGTGLVQNWTVWGDRHGDDAGVFTGVAATLNDVIIAQ